MVREDNVLVECRAKAFTVPEPIMEVDEIWSTREMRGIIC